jgi:hypothetical protein
MLDVKQLNLFNHGTTSSLRLSKGRKRQFIFRDRAFCIPVELKVIREFTNFLKKTNNWWDCLDYCISAIVS